MTTKQTPITKQLVRPKTVKPTKLRNEVALVLDVSGSMHGLRNTLVSTTNSWLDKLRKASDEQNQQTNVSLVYFSSQVDLAKFSEDISTVKNETNVVCGGQTALIDAVTETIDALSKFEKTKDTSMLIITITDGEENSSTPENIRNISELIRKKQATDKYTFVFMLPQGRKNIFCQRHNIPLDNVTEWEATETGMRNAEVQTCIALGDYFVTRSTGQTSVKSFYSQTDLSDLKVKDVKKVLTDVQHECKVFEVPKEVDISEFVTSKVGNYHPKDGKAYYQLTKREEIQPSKQILIMEKGKKNIYGGDKARELIGLHNGATDKVSPGNHSQYDVFIQSKSANRILVRGTRLIVRGS